MCASCGYPAAPGHWTDAGAADPGERLRARFRRAQVLNAVLRPYGLTAHDGGLIPGVQIATLSGCAGDRWTILRTSGSPRSGSLARRSIRSMRDSSALATRRPDMASRADGRMRMTDPRRLSRFRQDDVAAAPAASWSVQGRLRHCQRGGRDACRRRHSWRCPEARRARRRLRLLPGAERAGRPVAWGLRCAEPGWTRARATPAHRSRDERARRPGAIVEAVRGDSVLVHHIVVSEIIVAVDALNALEQLRSEPLGRAQIEVADRLVVTKIDAAQGAALTRLLATLRRLNPGAAISGAARGSAGRPAGDATTPTRSPCPSCRPKLEGRRSSRPGWSSIRRSIGRLSASGCRPCSMRAATMCFASRVWRARRPAGCCCKAYERRCSRRRSCPSRTSAWTTSWSSSGVATAQRTSGGRCNISPRRGEPHTGVLLASWISFEH